jgi:hypothetical protein
MGFSTYRDGDDAGDDELHRYSKGGTSLLCRLSYCFNLTRRTRRQEQGVPYLCGFPTYDWRRVCLTSPITRRPYPTTDHPPRRVYREHRRVVHLEPDERERFIYGGFECRRRVRRVL